MLFALSGRLNIKTTSLQRSYHERSRSPDTMNMSDDVQRFVPRTALSANASCSAMDRQTGLSAVRVFSEEGVVLEMNIPLMGDWIKIPFHDKEYNVPPF